ncbi:signal recognition particle receptor subunit alpha-like [Anneissia japonica]|uniref:signal recognition particle receptor subunit alpha-like n=1 Tax=Anneissia japonica TaxID=1529436 RepID=UPI0014258772|nr:signal recognition particle receptor subunit alpha-like [Anneissia japonica]
MSTNPMIKCKLAVCDRHERFNMLDLFTIFSKGGIVLWCFQHVQGICQSYGPSVNELIKNVILQERGGTNTYNHGQLTLKYKLDNEFELIFVVAYQKILTLSYVDKFLDDIHRQFRDLYKDDLHNKNLYGTFDFNGRFQQMLRDAEDSSKVVTKIQMKTFEESQKSKKTLQSMIIENKKEEKEQKPKKAPKKEVVAKPAGNAVDDDVVLDEETINRNRAKLFNTAGKKKKEKVMPVKPVTKAKRQKQDRKWENGGTSKDQPDLDYSNSTADGLDNQLPVDDKVADEQQYVGTMKGALQNIDDESSGEEEEVEEEKDKPKSTETRGGFGMFNMFKGLVSSKTLSKEDMDPVLTKMRDHLIEGSVSIPLSIYIYIFFFFFFWFAARDMRFDVVLVDTAGRMQDNEPLMRSLSKLIKINQPDLVLFVGEALVGNEAVDQLTKFNQALADHSNMTNPRLIDGIVLTKFDTIDDKVGAAISMTYTTGQPIVFVGTGQTYRDLRNLNVRAVVNALLKA